MSKYLFYAAFLYFCWYAGNKAFPQASEKPASTIKSTTTAVSTKEKYTATQKNAGIEAQAPFNSWLEQIYVQERAWLLHDRLLPQNNPNITAAHNLVNETPQLIILNKMK